MLRAARVAVISIHALREEGDLVRWLLIYTTGNFYPRPPRGGRRCCHPLSRGLLPISIHALREEGDRFELVSTSLVEIISIHALREEGDFFTLAFFLEEADFYPRPPRGGRRTKLAESIQQAFGFLSTPSARRATRFSTAARPKRKNFYPRPPRGGRRSCTKTSS